MHVLQLGFILCILGIVVEGLKLKIRTGVRERVVQTRTTTANPLQKIVSTAFLAGSICLAPVATMAAESYPLDKCFSTLQKEVEERPSLNRMKEDIETEKWDDLKLFTREYDAGLRGSVMKSVWKQLTGDKKTQGINLSNSFTFDLIGVNKAARKGDKEEALKYLSMVEKDLKDFLALKEGL